MEATMKVKNVRYFKTNRGVGYQCKTNVKGVEIWNDGRGGETYLETETPKRENKELYKLTEWDLERIIDVYEKGKGIVC
tara:strand:- start:247 stop:483 length:237 start_codon:yes stop_codon:yes gene_type:complete